MKIKLGQQCMKSSIFLPNTNRKLVSNSRIMSKTFEKNKLMYIDLKDFDYPGKANPTGVSYSWRFLYRDKESKFFSEDNLTFEFTVKDNILELEFSIHEYEDLSQDEQLLYAIQNAPFTVILLDEQGQYIRQN